MIKNDIDDLEVGDWTFINSDTYIAIRLGVADNEFCILPIAENPVGQKPWVWDGNKEFPTLTPSILHWGNGRNNPATWHGYLTNGKLVPC